ncbi:transcription factor NAI1-like [Hordeum vulgare subsp. vulgare]|nr:transcription factor NAI1-like [Hordeum vulgare subsp. vulgare]
MEDSSFLQWAINTLDQHTFPAATSPVYDIDSFHCGEHTADAFPLQQELRTAPQPLPGDNRDSSSGDVAVYAAVARPSTPISWKSSAALTQSATRGGRKHARARTSGSSLQGSATSSTSPDPARDHVIAERDRREKINQRLMELSSLIPGLKKMNKATIIEDAVKHVRELHEKVKILENNNTHAATTTICSAVLVHKNRPYLGGRTSDYGKVDVSEPSQLATWLPEIKVWFSDKSVLLHIHCENTNGILVRVLAEVEVLRLAITHTSSMPFLSDTTIINITAKLEEGFNSTVEEMVSRLNSVLDQH